MASAPQPPSKPRALELLALPALFAALWAAMGVVGAVPGWVPAGVAVYGGLAVMAVGWGLRARRPAG